MWVSKFRLEPSILFNEQNDATVKKDSIIRGSLSLYFSQGVGFGLSLVNAIVLARILTPHDYGIIGMATVFINFLVLFKDGEKFKKLYNKKVYSSIDRIVATELEYAERNDDLFRKKDTYSNIDFNPFRFNNGLKNAKKYLIQSSKKGIIENISQKRLRQLDHLIAETMKKINDNKTYSLNYRKTSKELKRKISCQVKVRNLCGYNVNSETIIGEVYFVFDASDKKIESKINKLKKVIENSVKKKL